FLCFFSSFFVFFFFSSRRRHTRFSRDWSSDVCSSDLSRLDRIHQQTSLPKAWFEQLFLIPLQRYAARVKQIPVQHKCHAYPGGLLDHSLALIESALRLRRARLLPTGAAPEEQAQQAEAWSTALLYAALLDALNRLAPADGEGGGPSLPWRVDPACCAGLQGFPGLWRQLPSASTPLAARQPSWAS